MSLSWPTPVLPRAAVYFCYGLKADNHGTNAVSSPGSWADGWANPLARPLGLQHRKFGSRMSAPGHITDVARGRRCLDVPPGWDRGSASALLIRRICTNITVIVACHMRFPAFPYLSVWTFMSLPIENYALIGNAHTAALVGNNGSIDWLCVPRFDSPACFAALLGTSRNGRWKIAPRGEIQRMSRRYSDETLVLETDFETETGAATVTDFMPPPMHEEEIDLVRLVRGRKGTVDMAMEAVFRFDYGRTVPWVRRTDDGLRAVAGPTALSLRTPTEIRGQNFRTVANFTLSEGQEVPFVLTSHPSHKSAPRPRDAFRLLDETQRYWREWTERCTYQGPWREAVIRSLITLKALTYSPTGGIVAAATTSLPEKLGGERNWDYRYCWLRDAAFTLYALLISGYVDEARAWREWLLRSAAGRPSQLQIMYGIAGERHLEEHELGWLPGHESSKPVRVGNGAHTQFQLDVYGAISGAFHVGRKYAIEPHDDAWQVEQVLLDFLESGWAKPDNGLWEVRGPQRHFTHSKVMAWVAFDRAIKAVERHGLPGPVEHWRVLRTAIHTDVCQNGFNPERNAFVQCYGSDDLDASLLLIPLIGFFPAMDPRVLGTVEAIERELSVDGYILRYSDNSNVDGLPPGEGTFLACTFWLADNLVMMGRTKDARRLFERLLSIRNDVGLLAEEYDPTNCRQLGNFPQAYSHVALINTAYNLQAMSDDTIST